MTDKIESITRRSFFEYMGIVGGVAGGFIPISAVAQEAPTSGAPMPAEDYSSPERAIATFYNALKTGDLDTLRRTVDPEFKFGSYLTGDFLDAYKPGMGIEAFFFSTAPAETRIGSRVYTRIVEEPIVHDVFTFPLSLKDAETLKTRYGRHVGHAKRDRTEFSVVALTSSHKIMRDSKELWTYIPLFCFELEKKDNRWKPVKVAGF